MNSGIKKTLVISMLVLSSSTWANKSEAITHYEAQDKYDLLNTLNDTLSTSLKKISVEGIKHISTYERNQQVVVQVIHDPKESFDHLVNDVFDQGGKVKGINFQSSFTFHIINTYCDKHFFSDIKDKGFDEQVRIEYKDPKFRSIATHRIMQSFCKK